MQLKLPATYKDITIKQIATHGGREVPDVVLLKIYAGLSTEEARSLPMPLFSQAVKHIKDVLKAPTQAHHKVIEVGGVKHGFIPDWSKFTGGEYIDLEELVKDIPKNATKIMAVLYRPITRQVGKHYEIEAYKGTEGHEAFGSISASYLYGALVFFSTIRNDYEVNGLRSLATAARGVKEAMRRRSLNGGDGTIGLFRWCKATLRGWTRRHGYL